MTLVKSIFTVNDDPPTNALGLFGSNLSAVLFVILGDASWLIPILMVFISRVVIIRNIISLDLFFVFLVLIFCIFLISISFSTIGLNSGIFGKSLIAKFRSIEKGINQYENPIFYI